MSTLAAFNIGIRRANRPILRNVSLTLQPGAILGVVGPNGSGKSTLLRCLSGLWKPTEGTVLLNGASLENYKRSDIARQVAYVPQEIMLEFEFSVAEVVSMGRYPHRGRFERERPDDRIATARALQRTDLTHLSARPVTQLSGGERQRVLIARSLATQAEILLLDEPTANLDLDHGLEVLELCRSLTREGRSIVIATHDINAICRFADHVALLDAGRVEAYGHPASVLTLENVRRSFHVQSEVLLGSDGTPQLFFRRLGRSETTESGDSAGLRGEDRPL